jgi:hypothetical protein
MSAANRMWFGRNVLVTGGTSFISPTLVDRLMDRGTQPPAGKILEHMLTER